MALELTDNITCPVKLLKVSPPKLGECIPAQVLAEITLDLKQCGERIRNEWDEIREFDNLFLVAVDATKMKGGPGSVLESDEQNQERRIPDDEDVTFPQRFGIVAVRGCMVLQVRDSNGTILSDPIYTPQNDQMEDKNSSKAKDFKRYLTVALDTSQYAADATGSGSSMGIRVYQMLNVVVRRKGKENNFKAVLETIRGLMEGSGSINKSVPSWLQPVFLGYGDPSLASFTSPTMKTFATNTVGVTNPDSDLDYGDTFLDERHLRESFSDGTVSIDGKDTISTEAAERRKYRVKMITNSNDSVPVISASSYPFPKGINGNPVRFTPMQVKAIQSGLNVGLTLIVGPPGTGKTDVAVQIIANLYHSFPSQRTVLVTHSNAALNDLFAKVMARGDVDERYMLRLGSGERDLETNSDFDFTKQGRVNHLLSRRAKLLEEVQLLSESIGISGAGERGSDGSPSYTCETAEYFNLHHVKKRVHIFYSKLTDNNNKSEIGSLFPFKKYFDINDDKLTLDEAKKHFAKLGEYFTELEEYRPLELLRSQRQRIDYLLTKQARIVAMTCTHAAIARSHLVELGFQYDNIIMEEAGQMLDIETFVPLLLQRGQMSMESRLKRICLIGDHNQLPPVVKNVSFSRYSNLDQSLFSRLIRLGVPSIDLNKQGRSRPNLASLYSWRYRDLGNLEHVNNEPEFLNANAGFSYTNQIINVEDYEGRGESTPTAYFYQNVGEAEYAVALFQFMVLIGYPPEKISILTTYNGQKELLSDIIAQRCGEDTPLGGVRPGAISTVDHYQGQQNDYIILSLVRTKSIGHLRDIRRLVVAVSRARLGLYVLCRHSLFSQCHELKNVFDQYQDIPKKLELVMGEQYPTERSLKDEVSSKQKYIVDDVISLGNIVHGMQEQLCQNNTPT
jgi:intron-binding protein aquarius